jgi:tyrosyl-tRNA synthetase
MVGRHLQKAHGQSPQCILTMPILEGTDGVNKMSKSLDNYISLEDTPTDMFGKMLSISDELMIRYYNLLSRKSSAEVEDIVAGLKDGSRHPMITKKELAIEIVNHYHPEGTGEAERKKFEERFSKNKIPDDILTVEEQAGEIDLLELMTRLEWIKSNGEGRRLFKQNAMKINFKPQSEINLKIEAGEEYILKAGKLRLAKIVGR